MYTTPSGEKQTLRGPRTLTVGGRRRIGVRVSVPSEVVVTGYVGGVTGGGAQSANGGGKFQLVFDADNAGQLKLVGSAEQTAVGRVEGDACSGAAAPEAAAASTQAADGGDGGGDAEAAVWASVEPNEALDGGRILDLYGKTGQLAPALGPGAVTQLRAYPDKVIAYRNEPVKIYILANDRIPLDANASVTLFDGTANDRVELASIVEPGGASEEDVVQRVDPNNENNVETWGWFIPETLSSLDSYPNYQIYRFQQDSYLTYTPSNQAGPRTVSFNYELGRTNPPTVGTVTVQVIPVVRMKANNDYTGPVVAEGDSVTIEVARNDRGPTGDRSLTSRSEGPTDKSYITFISNTNGKYGDAALSADGDETAGPTMTWTPRDESFTCGMDSFTYTVADSTFPSQTSRATVYVSFVANQDDILDDLASGSQDIPNWPNARDDTYEDVPRTRPFRVKLTENDDLCVTGTVNIIGKLDAVQGGRLVRNKNQIVWYPPRRTGLPDDVTEVSFQYAIGFDYHDAGGRRRTATSSPATVTLIFREPAGGSGDDY